MGRGRDLLLFAGLIAAVALVFGVTVWLGGSDDGRDDRTASESEPDEPGASDDIDGDIAVTTVVQAENDPGASETTEVPPHDLAGGAVVGGNAWLPTGGWFDLDNGDQDSTTRPPVTDLYLESGALTAGQDTFVTRTETPPTRHTGCDVTGLAPSLPLAQLEVGDALCVSTNGGRTAAVEILVVEDDELRFSYDVWEP